MRRAFPHAVRRLALPVVVAVLATLAGWPSPAGAESVDTLKQQQRELERQRAEQAAQLNVLKASNREVANALAALEANRRTQQAAVAAARERATAELARAAAARAVEQRTATELETLRGQVREVAIAEFMRGGAPVVDLTSDPTSPMVSARRRTLLSAAVGRSHDVTERLREVKEDHQLQREAAETAAATAAAEKRRLEQRLTELDAATARQRDIAAQAERKLESELAEAHHLAAIDKRLAARIAAEQEALARQLRTSPRPTSGGVVRRPGTISLSSVRGIIVASSIAQRLASLLQASDAAGLDLTGGGYRNPAEQAALRRAHCGTSDYDVYEKPASECSPPTARPGHSMHERGLAVDFMDNGILVTSRSSRAFKWLSANASRFGLYNLPSEPWHWSVNGE